MNIKTVIAAAVAALTPARSVSGIVADIERKVGQLQQAEERAVDKRAQHEAKAAEQVRLAVAARNEARRAREVAERLSALVR